MGQIITLILCLLVSFPVMASTTKSSDVIVLTSENTIQLSSAVNGPAIDILLQDLFKLKDPKTVYLVINSEGGEVGQGKMETVTQPNCPL